MVTARLRGYALGIAAAATVAGLLAPATPAAALTGTVSNVSVTPSSVAVDGLGDALVTVQVDIDEPRGAAWGVTAYLSRPTSGLGRYTYLNLVEVPGTRSGSTATFRGTWSIGAAHSGTWTLSQVFWNYSGIDGDYVDLRTQPPAGRTVAVTGTHAPGLASQLIPSVVPYLGRQWRRYTLRRADGTPISGAHVAVQLCAYDACPVRTRQSTDAHGMVTVRLPSAGDTIVTVQLPSIAVPGTWFDAIVVSANRWQRYQDVRASAPSAVRRGRSFVVRATVQPWPDSRVQLQRLVGRTWRTVADAAVGTETHALLAGRSTVLGRQYFRLRAFEVNESNFGGQMAPTQSRVFVVVGTRR